MEVCGDGSLMCVEMGTRVVADCTWVAGSEVECARRHTDAENVEE